MQHVAEFCTEACGQGDKITRWRRPVERQLGSSRQAVGNCQVESGGFRVVSGTEAPSGDVVGAEYPTDFLNHLRGISFLGFQEEFSAGLGGPIVRDDSHCGIGQELVGQRLAKVIGSPCQSGILWRDGETHDGNRVPDRVGPSLAVLHPQCDRSSRHDEDEESNTEGRPGSGRMFEPGSRLCDLWCWRGNCRIDNLNQGNKTITTAMDRFYEGRLCRVVTECMADFTDRLFE